MAEIVLITGLSGAGRSGAADVLEDLGWYVIDNLPTTLIDTIVDLAAGPGAEIDRLALVGGRRHETLADKVHELREQGHDVTTLFLDATTAALVSRYDATRRRHPLADQVDGLVEAIELERRELQPVRAVADLVIDTTDLNVHELTERIGSAFTSGAGGEMQVSIGSFGFKHGAPRDADIVIDVRFLPNPHWVPDLRPLTGLDDAVREHVLGNEAAEDFLDRFDGLLDSLLPRYATGGRSYVTVGVGCTGGRHRSVAIAEELARRQRDRGRSVRTTHRDLAT
ncbi:MAG: RNase adapter RapZ [Actinomycetota bacterium]